MYIYICIYSSVFIHSTICLAINLAYLPQPQPVGKSLLTARGRFSATEKNPLLLLENQLKICFLLRMSQAKLEIKRLRDQ